MSMAKEIHVGAPALHFPMRESVTVHFHDFAYLTPEEEDEMVYSPDFNLAGFDWHLGIDVSSQVTIGVYLFMNSKAEVVAECDISMVKSDGSIYKSYRYPITLCNKGSIWGVRVICDHFVQRADIFDANNGILTNGTVTFVVAIKPNPGYYCQFKQKEPVIGHHRIQNIVYDRETADIAFKVGRKVFYKHKNILKARAPELYELATNFDRNSKMPIQNVEPEIFGPMLKYLYGQPIFPNEWTKHSKQILEASGKYGFDALKIQAEAWHAKKLKLTVDYAIDELLYADGKHCLGLKKTVMDFIVDNGQGVIASPSFSRLKESSELMIEVMMELAKVATDRKQKLDETR